MKKMETKIKYLASLFLILSLIGCSPSFEERVVSEINHQCELISPEETCEINLAEITSFEWDTLYVFSGLMTTEEINHSLGFTCNCENIPDNYTRIILSKQNQIVYEDNSYGLDSEIQFHPIMVNSHLKFSKAESKFIVRKKVNATTKALFYDLYPKSRFEGSVTKDQLHR